MTDVFAEAVIRKVRRARVFRISIRQDGSIRLTLPWRVTLAAGKAFLLSKKAWILESRQRLAQLPPRLLMQGDAEEYRTHRAAARQLIVARVEKFLVFYGTTYRSLSIRNQQTRFGSCSARGHLSFNYRLLFLPPPLFDYVIAHEVCHLLELNHSHRFWALVAETIPDYQARKRELQAFFRQEIS